MASLILLWLNNYISPYISVNIGSDGCLWHQVFTHYLIQCLLNVNRFVSQMLVPLVACREPAGKLWQLCKVLYVFEHKTQYLLIHALFIRVVLFWRIGNIPPMISWSQICCNTAMFCIAAIFVKYCYTITEGCYNSWANLRCSSCSPLGEKSLWNGTIQTNYI